MCATSPAQIEALHADSALAIMIADPLALTLLRSPGDMNADIAVGSTQRFGVPMGYGGPHAAYMSCKDAYKRAMPGRIIGASIDARGNLAYRLALQTREQHIRREKANSNVCTAQALLAVMASMYAVFHGPEGLKAIAQSVHRKAARCARGLEKLGFAVSPKVFFDTITSRSAPCRASSSMPALPMASICARSAGTVSEFRWMRKPIPKPLKRSGRSFGGDMKDNSHLNREYRLPENSLRTSEFLTHPIFHMNRAEAEMTRYMRRLADRDLALDRAMIPLGSCTMKLNSTAEMLPVTWHEFSDIHPFAPCRPGRGLHVPDRGPFEKALRDHRL